MRLDDRIKPLRSIGRGITLAPLVMNPAHVTERNGTRHRMPELLGQPVCFPDGQERLVRVAEQPPVNRPVIATTDAGIMPAVLKCVYCVAVSIIKSDATLGVRQGGCRLPHRRERCPQRVMRLQNSTGVVAGLGGMQQELLCCWRPLPS